MRRPLRIAARIAVFALVGAAATVLVAWGISIRSPHLGFHDGDNPPDPSTLRWLGPIREDYPPRPEEQFTAWNRWYTHRSQRASGATQMGSYYGWPCRSLGWLFTHDFGYPGEYHGYLQLAQARGTGVALPLLPLWPGFLVDTAFWGGAAFIVWSVPRFVRRGVRRRRGRCMRCGYELLAGGGVCPECGGAA